MTTIQQVLATTNNSEIVKISLSRGPQDKFLSDEPVVSHAGSNMTGPAANTTGAASSSPSANPAVDESHHHWKGSKPVGSNMTTRNKTDLGEQRMPLANPAGIRDPSCTITRSER